MCTVVTQMACGCSSNKCQIIDGKTHGMILSAKDGLFKGTHSINTQGKR